MYLIEQGDCLELMKKLEDNSVDMVLCDLPYGITNAKWDIVIPFNLLWAEYERVVKKGGHIVLFSAQPFTTQLINSNLSNYKYNWYWKKNNVTGGQNSKVQPMRCIEDICVFRYDLTRNNYGYFNKCRKYLKDERIKSGKTLKELQQIIGSFMTSHYFTDGQQFALPSKDAYEKLQTTGAFTMPYDELLSLYNEEKKEISKGDSFTYNPQGLIKLEKNKINKAKKSNLYSFHCSNSIQEYTNYPTHLLEFSNDALNGINRLHPTQKPIKLLEYLIKTYTNEGAVVLDNCMGSGSTGVACINTNRNFIGYELTDKYFNIAKKRLEETEHCI